MPDIEWKTKGVKNVNKINLATFVNKPIELNLIPVQETVKMRELKLKGTKSTQNLNSQDENQFFTQTNSTIQQT